jgi:hypothetical protein
MCVYFLFSVYAYAHFLKMFQTLMIFFKIHFGTSTADTVLENHVFVG